MKISIQVQVLSLILLLSPLLTFSATAAEKTHVTPASSQSTLPGQIVVDPDHPQWLQRSGGRFRKTETGVWRDAQDTLGGRTDARPTVSRWRPAFQNEFAARMDWCVKPRAEANHPPLAVLNGDASKTALTLRAAPGERVTLSARYCNRAPMRDAGRTPFDRQRRRHFRHAHGMCCDLGIDILGEREIDSGFTKGV